MGGVPRKTNYKRKCRYCGEEYITKQKYSQMCHKCKEKRWKKSLKKRNLKRKLKPYRSYWKRLMEGEDI